MQGLQAEQNSAYREKAAAFLESFMKGEYIPDVQLGELWQSAQAWQRQRTQAENRQDTAVQTSGANTVREGLNPGSGTAYNESTPNAAEGLTMGESLTEGKDYAAAGEMLGEWAEGAGGAKNVDVVDNPFDDAGNLKPNVEYQAGEYQYNYQTDGNGRISNWNTGNLKLTQREARLPHNSNSPGKVSGDHAGHLAGDRFGGSHDLDNIVSQSKNLNLSSYKKIENQWANAIKEGKEVTVNVDVKYDGSGLRPIGFNIEYTINGKYFSKDIMN